MGDHNCRHLLQHLPDYVEGEADEAVCAEIEAHMAGCENCRVVVDTLKKTVELYHTLPQPEMPEDVRLRLFKSLDLEEFLGERS